jgi:hypothetical protein
MADAPYVYVAYPKVLYAKDGSSVVVQSATDAAAYPDYAESPAGPWPAPEPELVLEMEPEPEAAPAPPAPKPRRR